MADKYTKCMFCCRAMNKTLPDFMKTYNRHVRNEHPEGHQQWKLRYINRSKASSSVSTVSSTSETESNPPPPAPPIPAPAPGPSSTSAPTPEAQPESQPATAAPESQMCNSVTAHAPVPAPSPEPKSSVRTKSLSSSGYESLVQNEEDEAPLTPAHTPHGDTDDTAAPTVPEIEVITLHDSDSSNSGARGAAETLLPIPCKNVHINWDILKITSPPVCPLCANEYPTEDELDRHQRTHTKPSQCQECDKDFPEELDLHRHIERVHLSRILSRFPTPSARATGRIDERERAPPRRRRPPEFIKKISVYPKGHFWECTLCKGCKGFINVSQHLATKRHQKFANQHNVDSDSDRDRPPAVTIVDRNERRTATESLNPSTSSSANGGNDSASSIASSSKRKSTAVTPLNVSVNAVQGREASQHLGLLSPATSSNQNHTLAHVQTSSYDENDPTFCMYKCLKCGDEMKNAEAARSHFRSHAPKPKVKNLKCRDCGKKFDTKEAWKQDQLQHQNLTAASAVELKRPQSEQEQLTIHIPGGGNSEPSPMMSPPNSSASLHLENSGLVVTTTELVRERQALPSPSHKKRSHAQMCGQKSQPASTSGSKRSRSKSPKKSPSKPVKKEKKLKLLVRLPINNLCTEYKRKLMAALPLIPVQASFQQLVIEACVKVVKKK